MSTRSRLVVIGNGMAGARLVEDIVARGGRDAFEITMFGEEPYGNYNRILFRASWPARTIRKTSSSTPWPGTRSNAIRLHAGVQVTRIDRARKHVVAAMAGSEPYDKLVIATGSSPFVPPLDGLVTDTAVSRRHLCFSHPGRLPPHCGVRA